MLKGFKCYDRFLPVPFFNSGAVSMSKCQTYSYLSEYKYSA